MTGATIIPFPRTQFPNTEFAKKLERLVSIIAEHAVVADGSDRMLNAEEVEEIRRQLLTKILEARAELHSGC
jgi:hypothetical protein